MQVGLNTSIGAGRIMSATRDEWVETGLVLVTMIAILVGCTFFFKSEQNNPTLNLDSLSSFIPALFTSLLWVLYRIILSFSTIIPNYDIQIWLSFFMIIIGTIVSVLALRTDNPDTKTALIGLAGIILGFGFGIPIGRVRPQRKHSPSPRSKTQGDPSNGENV
jgi:hypothetical protein